MPDKNKLADLSEIATELLVAELKRRSEAKAMTVEELIAKAGENWTEAEARADALKKLGHAPEGENK